MSTGLDSLLTLNQQMLGVLQPRPVSTLHVGGGLKVDGALAVTGNTTLGGTLGVTNLTVAGTLGVTGATTLAGLTAGTTRLGQLNVGAGAAGSVAGDVAASRDSAPTTGVYYFGNSGGKYLYYDGSNFQLVGGRLNGQLTAGMAQVLIGSYVNSVSYNVPVSNVWSESPVQASCTFTGVLIRVEWLVTATSNSQGGLGIEFGVGVNGVAPTTAHVVINVPGLSYKSAVGGIWYTTPAAGAGRVSLFIRSAGSAGIDGGFAIQQLYVTEQRA